MREVRWSHQGATLVFHPTFSRHSTWESAHHHKRRTMCIGYKPLVTGRAQITLKAKFSSLELIRGLLHKTVRFKPYLLVGTFLGGRYVSQEGKCTYCLTEMYLPRVGIFQNKLFYVTGPRAFHRPSLMRPCHFFL